MEWISVKDRLPEGGCLVFLEEEVMGNRVHSASYHKNITIIGGRFEWDMPKVTHWMPLPELPK